MAIKKELFSKEPIDLDKDILTEAEIAEVELEAQAEVEKEAKDQARKALKAKLVRQQKRAKGLEEQQVEVTVDLAPYCDRILIDNVAFLQGVTYTVGAAKAQVMRETCQRTWNHQAEIDGKSENFYRRTRGARVLPSGAVVNNSHMLRA